MKWPISAHQRGYLLAASFLMNQEIPVHSSQYEEQHACVSARLAGTNLGLKLAEIEIHGETYMRALTMIRLTVQTLRLIFHSAFVYTLYIWCKAHSASAVNIILVQPSLMHVLNSSIMLSDIWINRYTNLFDLI